MWRVIELKWDRECLVVGRVMREYEPGELQKAMMFVSGYNSQCGNVTAVVVSEEMEREIRGQLNVKEEVCGE
jgi:hypothetical protein